MMDLATYRQNQLLRQQSARRGRVRCATCRQPEFVCYCELVKPVESRIHFVILIHPMEDRKRIATGRMSHLLLKNSTLIRGHGFEKNEKVSEILNDPKNHCLILYPGKKSIAIDQESEAKKELMALNKKLVVFVIDGTWCTANKMLRLSPQLLELPQIAFVPKTPSRFRVRKQPSEKCYSTIEAIHQTIDLLTPSGTSPKDHDHLLTVFDHLVETQLELMKDRCWRRVRA